MTLLEQLQSHRGGLIRLKTQLFWYDGPGHDNNPGRICLLLDAARGRGGADPRVVLVACTAVDADDDAAVLLLIEGQPQWVWVAEQDVEVIDDS